jgi:hypothetical protein
MIEMMRSVPSCNNSSAPHALNIKYIDQRSNDAYGRKCRLFR